MGFRAHAVHVPSVLQVARIGTPPDPGPHKAPITQLTLGTRP